jgi:FtsZ-interacting cell division protein ZipA
MKAYLRITGGMAVAVVLLTGAWANGQAQKDAKKGKNAGNPPAATQADTPSADTQKGKSGNMQNVKSNPLYKDNASQGNNPLYQGRDSAEKAPTGTQPTGAANTVEYKDPEDRTTRYRPGNNKTTKVQPPAANKNHETVEYKDPEDMTTRSKSTDGKTQKPK